MDTLTITELIEKLETIRGRHGDLPVYRINDDYEIGLKATPLTDPYEKERETINVRHLKKAVTSSSSARTKTKSIARWTCSRTSKKRRSER